MIVYSYDFFTGEYKGKELTNKDPMNPERDVLPAFSTEIKPPEKRDGYAIVFIDDEWCYVKDNRGLIYHKETGNEEVLNDLGEVPDGYTKEKPDSAFHEWVDNQWVENTELKEKLRIEELIKEAEAKILRGQAIAKLKYSKQIPEDYK